MKMIYIHKNDSTVFANQDKFLVFNIKTDLDLTGWKAEFCLCNVKKKFDNITSKSFEVILSAKDTSKMYCGKPFGEVRLIDNKDNVKTVVNNIPFCITKDIIKNESQTVDLDIPESEEISISFSVFGGNGSSNYEVLDNKPSINGIELIGEKSLDDLGIQPKGDYALKSDIPDIPDVDLTNLATKDELEEGLETKQPKGDYALSSDIPDVSNLATKDEIPTYIAGENITIENGVISSAGGSVDLTGYIKNKEAMSGSIVIGNTSTAGNAIVVGTNLRATGRYSIAMGDDCTLSNTSGISVGKSNYLNGTSNIAIGSGITTNGGNSIAIGRGECKSTGGNSISIGTRAQA